MFERFTDRARWVIAHTQEEARMLSHNYVGTEHLLLSLIRDGEGVASDALESLNISHEAATQEVEEIIGRGLAAPTDDIPFTPQLKRVLEQSLREARQLGHRHMGTEHLLLGVIHTGEGVAAQILQRLGASLPEVRQAVIRRLPAGNLDTPTEISGEALQIEPDEDEVGRAEPEIPLTEEPAVSFEEREKIVLSLLLEGLSTRQIAQTLGVSTTKVGEIIGLIIEKLRRTSDE